MAGEAYSDFCLFRRGNPQNPNNLWCQCHDGAELLVEGLPDQQVNISALRAQALPVLVLFDDFNRVFDRWMIAADTLMSLVPIKASDLLAIINDGQADQLLARVL